MHTTRRTFITGSLAATCCPTISNLAHAYTDDTTFAHHATIALNRQVQPGQYNPRVREYFEDPKFSKYMGVRELWNHYHNHWKTNGYRDPAHTYKCPCCFLVLFELSCGQPTLEDDFFRKYRGRNEFNWHYSVQWDRLDPIRDYSLDHYARLGSLDIDSSVEEGTEAGFAYYANGRQRVINFRGKEAFSFDSTRRDRHGADSVPNWLVPCR